MFQPSRISLAGKMAVPQTESDIPSSTSPLGLLIRRDSMSGPAAAFPTPTHDVNQDWSQWMRWDEPLFLDNAVAIDQLSIPSGLPFASLDECKKLDDDDADFKFSMNDSHHSVASPSTSNSGTPPNRTSVSSAGLSNEPQLHLDTLTTTLLSPEAHVSRKRKTSSDRDDGAKSFSVTQDGRKLPSKRRAHNVIEKRYRANLNDKIAELRDSVPCLRASVKQMGNGSSGDDGDDDDAIGVAPSCKLNKASILSKATEYIRHLEIRNKRLEEENTALKNRLRQWDKVAEQSVTSTASVSSPSNCTVNTESGAHSSPTSIFSNVEEISNDTPSPSLYPAEGLIKVPDSFKQMRASAAQSGPYAESYIGGNSRSKTVGGYRNRSILPNKYILGTIAGLMIFEGTSTKKDADSTAKELLAVPLNALREFVPLCTDYWRIMSNSARFLWPARALSNILIITFALAFGSAFLVFLYLFTSEQQKLQRYSLKYHATSASVALSPSSFRRQAWLTSIQQVGVPRHRFFREWYAVTSRCLEYVLRCLLGWKIYFWATGITAEDERGRVKAWDIAIDAQLAGGDPEISKSRLVLTIFAAGTLPRSPMRMMLKALHCRILLYRIGNPGSWTFNVANDMARSLARYQWITAREMHSQMPKGHPDLLPPHLAALLQFECEDVMIDSIIQRAVNLAWNRPTQEETDNDEVFLDLVEEDPAIQSSLDAFAAWMSSHLLQHAILTYFKESSRISASKKSRDLFKAELKLALEVAPQPSAAHTRALVMKAVFFDKDRVKDIGTVLAALPCPEAKEKQQRAFNFLDSSLPISVRDEISLAVRCAMISAILTGRENGDSSFPPSLTVEKAITWFNQLPLDPVELTLLGFAAVYHLLHVVSSTPGHVSSSSSVMLSCSTNEESESFESSDQDQVRHSIRPNISQSLSQQSSPDLGRVASELIYWARNAYNPVFYGISSDLADVIEKECRLVCYNAGVAVTDYSTIHERTLQSMRKDAKNVKASSCRQQSKSKLISAKSEHSFNRRESSGSNESNDTGYGSLNGEDDGVPIGT